MPRKYSVGDPSRNSTGKPDDSAACGQWHARVLGNPMGFRRLLPLGPYLLSLYSSSTLPNLFHCDFLRELPFRIRNSNNENLLRSSFNRFDSTFLFWNSIIGIFIFQSVLSYLFDFITSWLISFPLSYHYISLYHIISFFVLSNRCFSLIVSYRKYLRFLESFELTYPLTLSKSLLS